MGIADRLKAEIAAREDDLVALTQDPGPYTHLTLPTSDLVE